MISILHPRNQTTYQPAQAEENMNLTERQARETISRIRATQREKDALMRQWLIRSQGARASVLWLYRKQNSAPQVTVLESGEHNDPNLNTKLNEDDPRLTER